MGLLAGWLAGCGGGLAPPPENLEDLREGIPVAEWQDVTYTYTDSARLKARLTAPYIVERTNPESTTGENVQYLERGFFLTFFDATEAVQSTVTANTGEFYQQSGRAIARGNVVVTSAKNETLQTEELTWLRAEDKIRTDKPVTITTATEVLYGVGLESNTAFTEYTIFKLRGTVQLKDTPKGTAGAGSQPGANPSRP